MEDTVFLMPDSMDQGPHSNWEPQATSTPRGHLPAEGYQVPEVESLSTTPLLHIFASQPSILPKVEVQEHLIEGRLQDVWGPVR